MVILLTLKATYFRLFEWLRVVLRYYKCEPNFFWIDCLLGSSYLVKNPHRISRDFLKKRGAKNIYAYGETPLTTLDTISKACGICAKDCVFELGCGSGRSCFWLQTFVNCRTVGIDYLPEFIFKAKRVARWAGLGNLDFVQADYSQADLHKATVIYLYGTCLEDSAIEKLVDHFKSLRSGTKVITVSYPLTDFSSDFILLKEFTGRFPWGRASIYLNIKL